MIPALNWDRPRYGAHQARWVWVGPGALRGQGIAVEQARQRVENYLTCGLEAGWFSPNEVRKGMGFAGPSNHAQPSAQDVNA